MIDREKAAATAKRYRDRHRAEARERMRLWRAANPERALAAVRRARENHPDSYRAAHRRYYARTRDIRIERARRRRRELKLEVLARYGGAKCACCGETKVPFLALDHKAGGGSRHRREAGTNLYQWVKRSGFPPGFQVLCHNCNFGRWLNGGACPHVG